jgi:hypothetical protein
VNTDSSQVTLCVLAVFRFRVCRIPDTKLLLAATFVFTSHTHSASATYSTVQHGTARYSKAQQGTARQCIRTHIERESDAIVRSLTHLQNRSAPSLALSIDDPEPLQLMWTGTKIFEHGGPQNIPIADVQARCTSEIAGRNVRLRCGRCISSTVSKGWLRTFVQCCINSDVH